MSGSAMIDAWSIGVELVLDDGITGQLDGVSGQLDAVQEAIDKINASLAKTPGLIGDMKSAAAGLSASFIAAANAAERIKAAMSSGGVGGTVQSFAAPGSPSAQPVSAPPQIVYGPPPDRGTANLPAVMPGGSTTAQGAERWSHVPITGYGDGGTPAGGDGGAGDGGPPNFTVPGDEGPRGPVPLYPNRDEPFNAKGGEQSNLDFSQIFFGGMVVDETGKLVSAAFNADATPQHIITQMRGMSDGFSADDAQRMTAAGYDLQRKYPGLSLTGAMTMLRDSFNLDRNVPDAIAMADTMAKSAFVLNSLGEQTSEDAIYSLMRSGELRALLNKKNAYGTIDLTDFNAFIAQQTQISQGSGGRINPATSFGVFSMAGPEGILMDDEAAAKAAYLAQDLGATRVGVGINALATEFLGGKMSQAAARRLHQAGLLSDQMFYTESEVGQDVNGRTVKESDVGNVQKTYISGLGYVLLAPGSLVGQEDFKKDPLAWISNVFEPAVAKLKPNDQVQLLSGIYGDIGQTTGSRVAAEDIFQMAYLQRQLSYLGNTTPEDRQIGNLKQDPATVAAGFGTAFSAFIAAAASPWMPVAITGLQGLTTGLNALSTQAQTHPVWTGEADVAAVSTGVYGILKLAERLFPKSGFFTAGGAAADAGAGAAVELASGPAGVGIVGTQIAVEVARALDAQFRKYGLDPVMATGEFNPFDRPGGSPSKPIYTKSVDAPPAPASPVAPLTHMPAGPTTPPASVALPKPGAQSPR